MSSIEIIPDSIGSQHPSEQIFFDEHRTQIAYLLELLDTAVIDTNDLDEVVHVTQPWVKGDHSRPKHKFQIGEEQSEQLHDLYDVFGMKIEVPLPQGSYDQLLVLGGIHRGNNRRLNFMRRMLSDGVDPNSAVLLGGERKVYPEVELDDINANMRAIAKANIADGWIKKLGTGESSVLWETDLLRLAATVQLGHLATVDSEPTCKDMYTRPHVRNFTLNKLDVILMHTPAVTREGEARHTTQACIADWIHTTHPEEGSKIAFVTANPHIRRTGKVASDVLRDQGREDVRLFVGGPRPHHETGHGIFLGEVARNLYEDQLALKS